MCELHDRPDEQAQSGVHHISRDVRVRVSVQQRGERAARRQQDHRYEDWEAHCSGRLLQALPGRYGIIFVFNLVHITKVHCIFTFTRHYHVHLFKFLHLVSRCNGKNDIG